MHVHRGAVEPFLCVGTGAGTENEASSLCVRVAFLLEDGELGKSHSPEYRGSRGMGSRMLVSVMASSRVGAISSYLSGKLSWG